MQTCVCVKCQVQCVYACVHAVLYFAGFGKCVRVQDGDALNIVISWRGPGVW